jgi:hypothetical protein
VLEAGLGLQAVVLTGSAVAAVGFLVAGIELLRDRNRTAPQVADAQSTPAH